MANDDASTVRTGDDELLIERRIALDVDVSELWALVATAEGWRRWLVDAGEVDVAAGGDGRVRDGDVERDVRIATVDAGRSLTFTWWERDDPSTTSEVSIAIVDGDDGAGLHIVERIPAARFATAAASVADADAVRFAWEVRACVLWAGSRSVARV